MILKIVLLDFGGVIAEEGFREGLMAIAAAQGMDPGRFFRDAERIIFESGYVIGEAVEQQYWDAVRRETGITGTDSHLRNEILPRFVIRPEMLDAADRLRRAGLTVAMLSDQTDWLEEIDRQTGLFRHFDRVFNSFRIRKSKRDASVFRDVCGSLGVAPGEVLFVDDNEGHIERARSQGLQTHHFTGSSAFLRTVEAILSTADGS